MKNRRHHDPLSQNHAQHQMQLQDMNGLVLQKRIIPSGSDLKAEMLQEAARWEDEGWLIERDPDRRQLDSSFYMRRDEIRRLVALLPDEDAAA